VDDRYYGLLMLADHLGDILRKAREAANISRETAAKAAGIEPGEYDAFEKSGTAPKGALLAPLATILGLNATKTQKIADGWLPPDFELSAWREIRVITTRDEDTTVNCYLIWDEISREAALFDTGWKAQPILDLISAESLELKHLFLTHTDPDHIAAMSDVRDRFPKLHLHTNSKNVPPQHRNRANDFIHLGSLRITNREAPGHTEDGVIYVIGNWPEDAPHIAIVGDTIFAGSMARGKQSAELLKQKVREQIFSLPDQTLLCPGHGPLSTVSLEKANNPFF
jgi:glyoxylase-like metal-dependent hydrolase (beta-lactamase superfamily II)